MMASVSFSEKGPAISTDIILSFSSFMKLEKRQHFTALNYLTIFYFKQVVTIVIYFIQEAIMSYR